MEIPIDTKKKILSGAQFEKILNICGYTQVEFAEYIERHPTWVCRNIKGAREVLYRYYDDLVKFVGKSNFNLAVLKINKKIELREERRKELQET